MYNYFPLIKQLFKLFKIKLTYKSIRPKPICEFSLINPSTQLRD